MGALHHKGSSSTNNDFWKRAMAAASRVADTNSEETDSKETVSYESMAGVISAANVDSKADEKSNRNVC